MKKEKNNKNKNKKNKKNKNKQNKNKKNKNKNKNKNNKNKMKKNKNKNKKNNKFTFSRPYLLLLAVSELFSVSSPLRTSTKIKKKNVSKQATNAKKVNKTIKPLV